MNKMPSTFQPMGFTVSLILTLVVIFLVQTNRVSGAIWDGITAGALVGCITFTGLLSKSRWKR